jgi:hypothetical protein
MPDVTSREAAGFNKLMQEKSILWPFLSGQALIFLDVLDPFPGEPAHLTASNGNYRNIVVFLLSIFVKYIST